MERTTEKNVEKNPGSIESLQKKISELKKENKQLRKENSKIQELNVKQKVTLISQKNRIAVLEKLIPDTLKPKTIEDVLRDLNNTDEKQ
jgi:regulator of replication initiation timing